MTSARGDHVNMPYEANSYADAANNKLAIVPVVHCELGSYPKPKTNDVKDDCAGTGIGYLGGTVLLTPDKAVYGECRSGVTQMEAEFGPNGSHNGFISQLPVLEKGQNVERNGLRCSPYNHGVACGNVSAGVAFFVSREGYQLIQQQTPTAVPSPAASSESPRDSLAPKTPKKKGFLSLIELCCSSLNGYSGTGWTPQRAKVPRGALRHVARCHASLTVRSFHSPAFALIVVFRLYRNYFDVEGH